MRSLSHAKSPQLYSKSISFILSTIHSSCVDWFSLCVVCACFILRDHTRQLFTITTKTILFLFPSVVKKNRLIHFFLFKYCYLYWNNCKKNEIEKKPKINRKREKKTQKKSRKKKNPKKSKKREKNWWKRWNWDVIQINEFKSY